MNFRMIIENPATPPNYLITGQNFPTPTIIDKNRMLRGDVFKKPTAYWFFNCEPTRGFTLQNNKKQKTYQDFLLLNKNKEKDNTNKSKINREFGKC